MFSVYIVFFVYLRLVFKFILMNVADFYKILFQLVFYSDKKVTMKQV